MIRAVAITTLVLAVGCGRASWPEAEALGEAASLGWAPTLRVGPADLVGWIGVATAPRSDHAGPGWIAVDADAAAVVPARAIAIARDAEVLAVPATGAPVILRSGAVRTLSYGCDGGTLEVQTFDRGGPLPLGAVWLIPSPPPPRWQPAPIQLRAIDRSRDRRRWQVGPLEVITTRLDDHRARLAIVAGDRTLLALPIEPAFMTGAEPRPIDLAIDRQPGVPEPVAAFAIAPDGPALIVLAIQGFEGVTLRPILVGAERAEPVDERSLYLYQCAF